MADSGMAYEIRYSGGCVRRQPLDFERNLWSRVAIAEKLLRFFGGASVRPRPSGSSDLLRNDGATILRIVSTRVPLTI